jgi:hypothetical protein
MVPVFVAFGYQKWFEYVSEVVKPFNQPSSLVFWLLLACAARPFPGGVRVVVRRAALSWILEKAARHSRSDRFDRHYASTVSIIPFMPDGCAASAGGFPAMIISTAFLLKDAFILGFDLPAETGCCAGARCGSQPSVAISEAG